MPILAAFLLAFASAVFRATILSAGLAPGSGGDSLSGVAAVVFSHILSAVAETGGVWLPTAVIANLAGTVLIGLLSFFSRRAVTMNDQRMEKLEIVLNKLTTALTEEREARHQAVRGVEERVWSLSGDLREDYPKRHEQFRLFSSIARRVEKGISDLTQRIDALPCSRAKCPASSENKT